jgi:hypothetical protein
LSCPSESSVEPIRLAGTPRPPTPANPHGPTMILGAVTPRRLPRAVPGLRP